MKDPRTTIEEERQPLQGRRGLRLRWWGLVAVLMVVIIAPFLIWGEWFESFFDLQGAKRWLEGLGGWAWAGGMGLLIGDLVLPVPGTVVMSALGLVYGWFWGGLIGAVGSILSGMLAYGLCRQWGLGPARWLAGDEGLEKGRQLFAKESAGWLVALSRWMPVLPEAMACLAGLAKMPWWRFVLAVTAGSLPLGFAFAAIGELGVNRPGWALGLSAGLPVVLYGAAVWRLRRGGGLRPGDGRWAAKPRSEIGDGGDSAEGEGRDG